MLLAMLSLHQIVLHFSYRLSPPIHYILRLLSPIRCRPIPVNLPRLVANRVSVP